MLDLMIVREAFNKSWADNSNAKLLPDNPAKGQDSLVSMLIHDIFGGEILKTRKKRGWHFYNRIEGLLVDFTIQEIDLSKKAKRFDNISSSPSEISNYFAMEDYSNFFMRFVRAFEETVGLKKHNMA